MELLHQIYDRGAEFWIGFLSGVFSNLVAAAIVGLIARKYWRALLPPDLLKELIIARETRLDEQWDRFDRLSAELRSHKTRLEDAADYASLGRAWMEYTAWVQRHDLSIHNQDGASIREHLDIVAKQAIQGFQHPNTFPGSKKTAIASIDSMIIPEPDRERPAV